MAKWRIMVTKIWVNIDSVNGLLQAINWTIVDLSSNIVFGID